MITNYRRFIDKSNNITNEGYNDVTKDATKAYKKTLNKDLLISAKHLANMLNLSLDEGDIYAKSQYDDYQGYVKTKDAFNDLIDELNIDDFYYCYDTDEITSSEPESDGDFEWYTIEKDTILKALFGKIINYL